ATRTDHQGPGLRRRRRRPLFRDRLRNRLCRGELAAPVAIGSHEVRVAELTHRPVPILLPTRPEIAAGEPAEDGRPPSVGPFPLQRIKTLFYMIHIMALGVCAPSTPPTR